MRGDKKTDTPINKFIRELHRIGIRGEAQNDWLILGRDWFEGLKVYGVEWVELSTINEGRNIMASAGIMEVGWNGHKTIHSILPPITQTKGLIVDQDAKTEKEIIESIANVPQPLKWMTPEEIKEIYPSK
jgi:hypothetical protein